jgi:hypothetical protein
MPYFLRNIRPTPRLSNALRPAHRKLKENSDRRQMRTGATQAGIGFEIIGHDGAEKWPARQRQFDGAYFDSADGKRPLAASKSSRAWRSASSAAAT